MGIRTGFLAVAALSAACGGPRAPTAADSAIATRRIDDSVMAVRTQQAPSIADSARATLAQLVKHPETATFDSLIVVQPQKENGDWPTPYVCGRIGGKPGINGRSTPTPFIYRNRVTVFVLDETNAAAFAALRAKGCENVNGHVLLR